MVGHPKHVPKALAMGVDLICAQAGEGGGHTGDVPASILIPAVVDACRGHVSPLTKKPVYVIGAGAVYDGRGLAANLAWGAQGVWVGTRFVASTEANAPKAHKDALITAGYEDAITTIIYTGRPLRVRRTPYVEDWYVPTLSQFSFVDPMRPLGIITARLRSRSSPLRASFLPTGTLNNTQRSRYRLEHS
jgi:NAD(P)H-dependent flavin oxidoreductase YrpB (nitropropane dioxygenase family)